MENAWTGMVMGLLILLASMASVEVGLSVALVEFGRIMGGTTQNLSRLSPCTVMIVK